ncbi:ABC transporter ATP-binding protein [Hoeflea alexandrii]|uniref:Spermidine/putrescine import ATP-binding protein PotA n=1 Tax=Hoeflea alexandrii TaxID=288436 RepID=A0ABT1CVK9_9HYPH|nr:ABC transporter ATP-binding protein [Hoeflea alexandrii]MCO6410238.1 polyamine ABC transporter ATP-binding protein [Hoeflea alexandrii]MCY0153197.1 ABC transporter ATP-binding protein [Hoeflea alexandrii]
MIEIRNVDKNFGTFRALDTLNATIGEGEFFSLLGPSGCGKTTLLRMIGGFDDPSSGEILIGGRSMAGIPPNLRPTNMVFQSYAIFPHLNVAENIAYGLKRLRLGRAEEEKRVKEALDQVELSELGPRMGNQLSGGQRQRVALARALVMRPKVLLLDEPLSALDKNLREQMQVELRHLQRQIGITFVLVTHDQYEALSMSDRIAVMFGGQIAQIAEPKEIYQNPATRQVADFLGGMNFLTSSHLSVNGKNFAATLPGIGDITGHLAGKTISDPAKAIIGIRPERLRIVWEGETADPIVTGKVADRNYFGEVTSLAVNIEGQNQHLSIVETNDFGADDIPVGSDIRITYDRDAFIVMQG